MTRTYVLVAVALIIMVAMMNTAQAQNDCHFRHVDNKMILKHDCITDETIFIPNKMTLDGRHHTITAVDPHGGHFTGAVVKNAGEIANVKNLKIRARNLANVCDKDENRLRGIMFDGASGSISWNKIVGINQGHSGCQEGNAIEVRNAPFDGTHPHTRKVSIIGNKISSYQKTGIVANGDVDVKILFNHIGSANMPYDLAANTIQLGWYAKGIVKNNVIEGNQWCGPGNWESTAILVYLADDNCKITGNYIGGNSDIGIYYYANNGKVVRNIVYDSPDIPDCNAHGYDTGIGNWGNGNIVSNNMVFGFTTQYEGPHINTLRMMSAPVSEKINPFM